MANPAEMIDALQAAVLCGRRSAEWTYGKLAEPNFPRPVSGSTGPGGRKKLWRRRDIIAWREAELVDKRPDDAPAPTFASDTAVQFICGGFDPPHKQIDRRRRIERSRRKGVKNQTQIRTQGDW
jgi:predicted DNA-binding transcriptional regulator AlpA